MLPLLLPLFGLPANPVLAQSAAPTDPVRQEVVKPQLVRPLPGQLDNVPVFNSNSPELVQTEGILLSTFPPAGKATPSAHLNVPLNHRFDIFAHHIAKATSPDDLRTLFLGIVVRNPNARPVQLSILQAASYLSQPDAPFIDLPSYVENPDGDVYAGPGSRVTDEILRGQGTEQWPALVTIPPKSDYLLVNLPIPVKELEPPINGRSMLMRLRSTGPVYVASLARFAQQQADGTELPPDLADWQQLLTSGAIAGPRDLAPTPPEQTKGFRYGRVAGVVIGSYWQARLADSPDAYHLTIPAPGEAISYGISTLNFGTLGTGQIQSAPMVARYGDTAYRAHGNYGIQYQLTLPLLNPTARSQRVTLALQTPIKEDQLSKSGLRFFQPPEPRVFFRGTVRVRYTDERGLLRSRYIHLVQQRGQQGQPLATLDLPAGDRRIVTVDLIYPPDSTPPQVLTLRTLPSQE